LSIFHVALLALFARDRVGAFATLKSSTRTGNPNNEKVDLLLSFVFGGLSFLKMVGKRRKSIVIEIYIYLQNRE
jgi:hypothetical protein